MSLSYPGILEQQYSDKGNDTSFTTTLKQGCATHGPKSKSGAGADVFWPAERARFPCKHYGF